MHDLSLSQAPGMVVGAWLVADEVDGKCHPKVLTFDLYHLKVREYVMKQPFCF